VNATWQTLAERSGRTIEVITVSDASHEECSLGDVAVFVVSQRLGIHLVPERAAGHDGRHE